LLQLLKSLALLAARGVGGAGVRLCIVQAALEFL
jgi:hypothetical protein